jgi:hypothetical protein
MEKNENIYLHRYTVTLTITKDFLTHLRLKIQFFLELEMYLQLQIWNCMEKFQLHKQDHYLVVNGASSTKKYA